MQKKDRSVSRKALLVCLFILLLASALLLLRMWDQQQGTFPSRGEGANGTPQLEWNGKKYELRSNVETFLLVGLDKFSQNLDQDGFYNDQQADFLLLIVMDHEAKSYGVVPVNRDTMTNVNVLGIAGQKIDSKYQQIALSHNYGNGDLVSLRNTADAVSGLLYDIDVNHYMSATMDAVPVFNDLLGGVTVEILDDFTDMDPQMVKGETVTLTGQQALLYVRARQSLEDSTNINRMKRQQQYLVAMYEKAMEKMVNNPEFLMDALLQLGDKVLSNTTGNEMQRIFERTRDYEYLGMQELEGMSREGEQFMEFYPDDRALLEKVLELFFQPK